MENIYYDGTKLLSLKDLDGDTPSMYICCGNRTAGKSVFFKRLCLNNWIKSKKQFILIYRFNYELPGCSGMFFNDIQPLFFPDGEMKEESVAKGLFYKLYYNEEVCGFAVSLSNCDALKKYSSFFIEVENAMMDEFQSETNRYATNEIQKLQSLIVTISRGHGKQFRYVRIFLVSNTVSILNPYYVALGIHKRLRSDTKFMRGFGWVFENTFNENASSALMGSGFAKAFAGSNYLGYAAQNVYLNDNKVFVEKMHGMNRYKATIKVDGKFYSVREFYEEGIVYISETPDMNYPILLTFKSSDHVQNALMVDRSVVIMQYLRSCFNKGCMRFENLSCKDAIFDILSI